MILENPKENAVQQFTPLPKQKLFLHALENHPIVRFIWYCGGFGSGKSFIGSHAAVRLGMLAPNGRGLIARSTLVDLKATTMKTFFEVCDRRLIRKWNKSENLLTLINGHEIYFWGLDDIEKLKSLEIGWFWVDEVNEVDENTFNVLKGRLRHKAQPKRCGLLTSNSEGKNWTYKQFIQGKGIRTAEQLKQYLTIKAPSTENKNLPDDYIDILKSYTGDLYDRYVNASFDVFEGQIFPDFIRAVHVIKPFKIPNDWKLIGGVDHGERNPTVHLWAAVAPWGDIFFYREYYQAGEFVDYHVKQIYEAGSMEKDVEYRVFDPSIKSVRGKSGRKVDQEYKEEWKKITKGQEMPMKMANNNVSAGIARVHKYLRIDPERVNPFTKIKGAPRVYFFDTCVKTIEELEGYKWAKQSVSSENDPDEKPRKKDDHTCDVVRYMIMSRPDITIGTVASKYPVLAPHLDPLQDQLLPGTSANLLLNAFKNNPEDFIL